MASSTIDKLADSSQALIDTTHSDVMSFFSNLFTRQEFTARLVERSFNTTSGLLELALCAGLMLLTFWLSRLIMRRRHQGDISGKRQFIRHLIQRILWPVLLLLAAVAAMYLWKATGHRELWLQLLVMAARWMIAIRFVLAVLHAVIPNGRFSSQLERSLAAVLWVVFVLWLTGLDAFIINVLKSMVIPLGSSKISVYTILTGLLSVCVVVVVALWVAQLLDNRLMQVQRLDLNLRLVLSKIVKTLLVTIAVLAALPMVGIDLTVLSVFGGALGVGLGIGLQKIASNYISGFIILSDRSIRLGDRLTVNDFTGYVTKITSRFVVLRSAGGAEALVPNDNFISSTVINESYTGKSLWTSLDVQVAYATDLPQALDIMKAVAAEQERVAADPAPNSFLVGFADSGINLRLGFWVNDPENGFLGLNSAILLDIWRRFNEEGIEFPFPQREVRILNEAEDNNVAAASLQAAAQLTRQSTQSNEPASAGADAAGSSGQSGSSHDK